MARKPFNPDLIRPPDDDPPSTQRRPLTVSQLTARIKGALELTLPATLHVVGEISNFKRHSSGHLYFTMKDASCELSCVMWRSAAKLLKFQPGDGLEVIATGGVEVFERAGRYQLYVRKLEPRGVGSLELAFRQLCDKLEEEGLFDPDRKKPIPTHPATIAVVTSPTGAAIADMVRTIERRFPCVRLLVYPVRVQGDGAAREIADAIAKINVQASALGGIDVMIVGRGGGSIEDLWAFNEEVVARSIYASRIPVISAVGHEVDVTVADLVADVRAATPTAGAELAVPVLGDMLDELHSFGTQLYRALRARLGVLSARFGAAAQRKVIREPFDLVRRREILIDEWERRMSRAVGDRSGRSRRRLAQIEPIIQRIAPHTLLTHRAVGLRDSAHRLRWAIVRRFSLGERRFVSVAAVLDRTSPAHTLVRLGERLSQAGRLLSASSQHRLRLDCEQLRRRHDKLIAMSYKSVLGRGFSITRLRRKKTVVRSIKQLSDRHRLVTELADGEFESEVINLTQLELFE